MTLSQKQQPQVAACPIELGNSMNYKIYPKL
uniref:Uncharacterized protein n=1 Tax=Rhizophora mucronata TaxID=61149 RepID=A0A2P2QDJ7_RHIMU